MKAWFKNKLKGYLGVTELELELRRLKTIQKTGIHDVKILYRDLGHRVARCENHVGNLSALGTDVPVMEDNGFIVFASPLQGGRCELIQLGKITPRDTHFMIQELKERYGSKNIFIDAPQPIRRDIQRQTDYTQSHQEY